LTSTGSPNPPDRLFAVRAADYGPEYRTHLLKQYKLAVERADAVSERRATTNEFYLVLMSVILSVAGIGVGGTFVGTPVIPPKIAPWISLAGIAVAASWLAAIYASNQLNRAKFYVINRLEEQLPAAVFTVEWNYRTSGTEDGLTRTRRLYTSSTIVESVVPLSMLLLFIGLTVYLF
jgi:hypothetical protein